MNPLLFLNTFIVGHLIMSLEMIAGRVLTPYFGSSLIVWASVIAITLLAMSAGYLVGGQEADRAKSLKGLAKNILNAGMYISICGYYLAHVEKISNLVSNTYIAALLAAIALLFVPCYFLSTFSPYALKFLLDDTADTGKTSGKLYALATVGSIFGTLFTSFILINYYSLDFLYMITGLMTIVCGISLLIGEKHFKLSVILYILFALLYAFNIQTLDYTPIKKEAISKLNDGVIEKQVSGYNNIYIRKNKSNLTMLFNLENDHAKEASINLDDPNELPFGYTQLLTYSVAFPNQLKEILLLGLGGGTVSNYLKRHMPDSFYDVVEIDPKVIGLSKKYFDVKESPRYKVHNQDARVFVSKTSKKYDLIIQDTFRGRLIPFHLSTKEYFSLAKSKLSKEGCFAANIIRRTNGIKTFESQIATLKSVFPQFATLGYKGNYIFIGCNSEKFSLNQKLARAISLQRSRNFKYPLNNFIKYVENMLHVSGRIYTDNFAPLNTVSI